MEIHTSPHIPELSLPAGIEPRDLSEMRRECVQPFLGKYCMVLKHLNPEWVNGYEAVRMRIFNGGVIADGYTDYDQRYCLGIGAYKNDGYTKFVAELHRPLPLKDPYRIIVSFTPWLLQASVQQSTHIQMNIFTDTAEVEQEFQQNRHDELHHLFREISGAILKRHVYLKRYRENKRTGAMSLTKFSHSLFQRQKVRDVGSTKEERHAMFRLLYS